MDTKEAAIRLWAHECQRVFSDRFVQDASDDVGRFREVGWLVPWPFQVETLSSPTVPIALLRPLSIVCYRC